MEEHEAFFREAFRLARAVVGVTAWQELIGYSIIRLPGAAKDYLGKDLGLPEEELCRVAHLQATAVHPAHRGRVGKEEAHESFLDPFFLYLQYNPMATMRVEKDTALETIRILSWMCMP